jgi:hypothetical protein
MLTHRFRGRRSFDYRRPRRGTPPDGVGTFERPGPDTLGWSLAAGIELCDGMSNV